LVVPSISASVKRARGEETGEATGAGATGEATGAGEETGMDFFDMTIESSPLRSMTPMFDVTDVTTSLLALSREQYVT
jgi:hypothetical protein